MLSRDASPSNQHAGLHPPWPQMAAPAGPTAGCGFAVPDTHTDSATVSHQLLQPGSSTAPEQPDAAPAGPHAAASGGQSSGAPGPTFSALKHACPRNAALHLLWGVAQGAHGPDADPDAVQVTPLLQLWAKPGTLNSCRDRFSTDVCTYVFELLQGLQQLGQQAVQEALGQQEQGQMSAHVAQLLEERRQQVQQLTHRSAPAGCQQQPFNTNATGSAVTPSQHLSLMPCPGEAANSIAAVAPDTVTAATLRAKDSLAVHVALSQVSLQPNTPHCCWQLLLGCGAQQLSMQPRRCGRRCSHT